MRIAFITQILWERYGDFWTHLVKEVGAELLFASKQATLEHVKDERLDAIPSLSFQLAAAQSLALLDADMLVVPDLSGALQATKGAGQDPWIANLPETLETQFAGLPPILAVPTVLTANLETLVIETLMNLSRDPAGAKRAWERHKGRIKSIRKVEPRWQKRASEKELVAVLAQPWLKPQTFLSGPEDVHIIFQSDLNPLHLQAEGQRYDAKLAISDQEVIGAARLLARRGTIDRLIFIADKLSGSDLWLYERLKKLVHKPLDLVYLQDLGQAEDFIIEG